MTHDGLTFSQAIGARMRAIRELFGVSQAEIAEALNVDEALIARYEAGEGPPPPYAHLLPLSIGFAASPNWLLLGWTDDLPPIIRAAVTRHVPHLVNARPPARWLWRGDEK